MFAEIGSKPSWDIGLIIDQSGSMTGMDSAGFSLLGPAILADLSTEGDVVRVHPQGDKCL